MKRGLSIVLVGWFLCAIQATAQVASPDGATRARARELASMILSNDAYQGLIDRSVPTTAVMWLANAGHQKTIEAKPHLAAQLQVAVRTALVEVLPRNGLVELAAQRYVSSLTAEEMDQAIQFFHTPAGAKMLLMMTEGPLQNDLASKKPLLVARIQGNVAKQVPELLAPQTIPKRVKDVAPLYSAAAQSAGIQGEVVVEATIGPEGKVTGARVLKSVSELDEAALDAVRQWEFTPCLIGQVAVPVVMTVTVRFSLQNEKKR